MLLEAHRYSGSFGHQWKKCKPFEIPSFKHKTCFLLVGRQKGVDETCISDQFFFQPLLVGQDFSRLHKTRQQTPLLHCTLLSPTSFKAQVCYLCLGTEFEFQNKQTFFFFALSILESDWVHADSAAKDHTEIHFLQITLFKHFKLV